VIIASLPGLNVIKEQLLNMGIEHGKIITSFVEQSVNSRIVFLENLAFNEGYKGVKLAVQDFAKTLSHPLKLLPIGDGMSICVIV